MAVAGLQNPHRHCNEWAVEALEKGDRNRSMRSNLLVLDQPPSSPSLPGFVLSVTPVERYHRCLWLVPASVEVEVRK